MNFGGSRLTPLCKYCGREVRHAQIEAKLTAEVCREGVEEVVRVKEKAKFLQPRALFDELQRMMIEGDLKISLKALRDEKSIFWNLLYQFNVFSLPYALMLPYFEDGAIEARDPYSPAQQSSSLTIEDERHQRGAERGRLGGGREAEASQQP
eukprot:CAMPEP_0202968376 /NCGR_PEP_ID=MMETSP1396-20130829/13645_1 /ASSEMBLY_ACC=CAM_ASM_000872 /TAXON_ID= /ORGANISM="Pseudokeronopsis sp., Strain Brazil" /LENGTH=151 /DNA_ID=CAMNT_0049694615 /DNA_START=266 /DNA_END=716 /DNA_ORIENTATION=-